MSTASAPSSDVEIKNRGQQSPLASRRVKAAASEAPEGKKQSRLSGVLPLGYKEGFSQWWASIPAAQAEHRVLSFIPYLQSPPTQTESVSAPPSVTPSEADLVKQETQNLPESPVTTSQPRDPHGPRRWQSRMVSLPGKNRALNEFSVERLQETPDNNLVILHGYGAGLGFFYKNFEGLSRSKGWKLYALDLLGMGRSSRPPFKMRTKTRAEQITEAEDWFIDALEEWRIQRKLERFTLLGHSMGGYMAVCYALKYPGHLNKLILASPVGIPEDPYAVQADMPEPTDSTLANEFTQDQELDIAANSSRGRLKPPSSNAPRSSSTSSSSTTKEPPRRTLPKWLTYLWDANISPFSFVRWAGPLGPRLVSGWTSRRFSHLPTDEANALHDYSYSLFRLRGSGEYALAYILAPGAFARSPLIRRIGGVGRQMMGVNDAVTPSPSPSHPTPSAPPQPAENPSSSSTPSPPSPPAIRENGIPIVLMYGENDWMDVKGGYAAKEKINAEKEKILKEQKSSRSRSRQHRQDGGGGEGGRDGERDNGGSKVVIVSKAGHHLYLDNAEEFNGVMREEMRDVERREGERG